MNKKLSWVENIPNTGWKKCKCDSWLAHWGLLSQSLVFALEGDVPCSACNKIATLGAHVTDAGPFATDSSHYIIPLCAECNKRRGAFRVREGTIGVSANVAETCG